MNSVPKHIAETIQDQAEPNWYIYDLWVMNTKMDALACLPGKVETFYAMKVNPHVEVVTNALNHENIRGIEVASAWEIEVVQQAWEQDLSKVIYTWPGKKREELQISVDWNIRYLNVESLREAIVTDMIAKQRNVMQPILLRLNSKHAFWKWEAWVTLWSGSTQFWVPQDDAVRTLRQLEQLENLKVDGFHVYPATWVMSAEVLLWSVERTFQDVVSIEKEVWKTFKTIDFWGGFWIDYGWNTQFNIQAYSIWLQKLIEKYDMQDRVFLLELGRFLWADMWYYFTKITDIKQVGIVEPQTMWQIAWTILENWQKIWEIIKWVICEAGTNWHKRPQVLWVDYHIEVLEWESAQRKYIEEMMMKLWWEVPQVLQDELFNVYGSFCTSVDFLAKWVRWKVARIWDFIVMPQSGAYWKSMSPQQFLSHPEVAEIVIK